MTDIRITVADRPLEGSWLDGNPATREAIAAVLPISGTAARWGEELYLGVDIEVTPADVSREVDPGCVAYWPDGPAICLFWGPTPASTDETPVAASPVAPIAAVADVSPLADLEGGAELRIEAV